MGHVQDLVKEVAEVYHDRMPCRSDDENWNAAESAVWKYFSLRSWDKPEEAIEWYVWNSDVPAGEVWHRNEVAWDYLVEDVLQRPLVRRYSLRDILIN